MARHFEYSRQVAQGKKPNLTVLDRAEMAILYLHDHNGWLPSCTREDFAKRMNWLRPDGEPDRRMVEHVFTMTREQHRWEEVASRLGGYVIAYAETVGGVAFVGSDGLPILPAMVHILRGDAVRDQTARTENARRLPTLRKLAEGAANDKEFDLWRIFNRAYMDVERDGFYSTDVAAELDAYVKAHGL